MNYTSYLLYVLGFLISLNAPLYAADFDEAAFKQRKATIIQLGESKYFVPNNPKLLMYDVLAATAKSGCANKEWADYIAKFTSLKPPFPADGPVEMFALPPFVRYLYQFGHCLTKKQKRHIIENLVNKKQILFGHGTLNHAIMRASSWYLLAQYFPKAKWQERGGNYYTSQQIMSNLKGLLEKRNTSFMMHGHYEWLSPTYAMINFAPLLNIIDFANDPDLKKLAEKEAELELLALKTSSFHGVIVPPLTRKNIDQLNASDIPQTYFNGLSQHILWYYFGEPVGLKGYDFHSGKEPFVAIMLALSNWVPSIDLLSIKDTNGVFKINTPGFSIWGEDTMPVIFGDSFMNNNFAIGTGNGIFNPNGYSGDAQKFSILLKTDKAQNQIECYHPYWRSNQGEDSWDKDRSSPFQQMYRYDDSSVVMLFNIPDKDPWAINKNNKYLNDRNLHVNQLLQVVSCRMPKNLDQIVKQDNWIFLREGETVVAISTLNGFNYYNDTTKALRSKFLSLKVREPKTALFFRVDTLSKSQNFQQFIKNVRKLKPHYDVRSSTVTLKDKTGVTTKVRFNLEKVNAFEWSSVPVISHDGVTVKNKSNATLESQFVTLKNSKINYIRPKAN